MRRNYYSVPARYAGRRLPVRLSATAVEVLDGPRTVARHDRTAGKYAEVLVLDHYLEVLRRKPGALPGASALAQARADGTFGAVARYWDAARRKHGDAAGTRAWSECLLAHRACPPRPWPRPAMTAAVSSGITDPQVIVIEARRHSAGQAAPRSSQSARWPAMTAPGPGPGRL